MRVIVVLLGLSFILSACETFGQRRDNGPIDTISVRYDPYNYSMADLKEDAKAACRAKGGEDIYPVDNQINSEEVRWAYMNFECF